MTGDPWADAVQLPLDLDVEHVDAYVVELRERLARVAARYRFARPVEDAHPAERYL